MDIEKLVQDIEERKVVPIICDDMLEYIEDSGDIIPFREFICRYCWDEKSKGISQEEKDKIVTAIQNNFYYGMTLLENKSRRFRSSLYQKIAKAVSTERLRIIPKIKEFLRKANFSMIITTIGFEEVFNGIFPEGSKKARWYNPSGKNDIPLYEDNSNHFIYHIFGGEHSDKWVYNEQTLITFMHALHSVDYGAKNLINYLNGNSCDPDNTKRLFVMGSILPDWIFRFLVYPMYKEKISEVGGYWISLNNLDESLDYFLDRNNYEVEKKCIGTIDSFSEELIDNTPLLGSGTDKGIAFVSYRRNDIELGGISYWVDNDSIFHRILEHLENHGYKVWVDMENTRPADTAYWAKIKAAIEKCQCFVPIVTNSYIEAFKGQLYKGNDMNWELFLSDNPITNPKNDNHNDSEDVQRLKPIVRETYYALSFNHCKFLSLVILGNGINVGSVDDWAKDETNHICLPPRIFADRTLVEYDINNPPIIE